MKRKWYSSIISNSASSYDLPKLKKKKQRINSIKLTFIDTRNAIRKELDSFHKTNLFEKYNKNFSELFLTNTNHSHSSTHSHKEMFMNGKESNICPSPIHGYKLSFHNNNEKSGLEMYFSDIGYNKNSDYLCKTQSTQSLIDKTKSIMRSNYIKSIQETHFSNLSEEINHQNLQIDLRMYHLKKRYKLLLRFLNYKFEYVKYLNQTINKQKAILVDMEEKRDVLEKEINQLKGVITKKQNYISKATEYKEFLLKVKYIVSNIKDIPYSELRKYGYAIPYRNSVCNGRNSFYSRNSFNSPIKGLDKSPGRFRKRHSILKGEIRPSQKKPVETRQKCIPIFFTTDEFNYHFTGIEKKTFYLFQKYSAKNEEIIYLKKEKRKCIGSEVEESNLRFINRLIEEKDQLIHENNKLDSLLNSLKNSMKKEDIKKELKNKLREILLELPMDIETELNENNFYHILKEQANQCWIKGKEYNIVVYLIQIFERVLIFYLLKLRHLNSNPYYQGMIQDIKKNIEKKKRIMNNKRNKEAMITKRKNMEIKIMIKNMKIHFKRRGMPNITLKKHKRDNSKDKIREEINETYEKLFTY